MSTLTMAPLDAPAIPEVGSRARLQVNWITVGLCAVVIAYMDGFCLTSLHGAVGTVDSSQSPFAHWLRDSTLMLAPVTLGVLAALTQARRWVGRSRREIVRLAGAALLIIVVSSAVSIAQVAVSSAKEYKIQSSDLGLIHSTHATVAALPPGTAAPAPGSCVALCAARRLTLHTQLRAVALASVILLIVNAVLVVWTLALRGGRLWPPVDLGSADARAR